MPGPPLPPISVSVGICAYNEERNIGQLLEALQRQRTEIAEIAEILVVASGCTDGTSAVVESFARRDLRIRLIRQREREGKASAVGVILREARSEVVILESADTVPAPEAVERLAVPFRDPGVGVVAARPIPLPVNGGVWDRLGAVLWTLHHEVSTLMPKVGEMLSFRSVLISIPEDAGADEDWIQEKIARKGFATIYDPRAIVHNTVPQTMNEFLKQRVRWNSLELHARRASSVLAPTWRLRVLTQAVLNHLGRGQVDVPAVGALAIVELAARGYSMARIILRPSNLHLWEELPSTKSVRFRDDG